MISNQRSRNSRRIGAREYREIWRFVHLSAAAVGPVGVAEKVFLHLIHVGDTTLTEMVPAELIRQNGNLGVTFSTGEKEVRIVFGTTGKPSGHVTITSGNTKLIDKDLIGHVSPQAGLSGTD